MKRRVLFVIILALFAAGPLRADDTEIYGTVTTVDLQPNILIIFDTSGSMGTVDVPGDPYNPAITYTGSYPTNTVYERHWNSWTRRYDWQEFASDVNAIGCGTIKTDLLNTGYAEGYIRSEYQGFSCGGQTRRLLRLGNYMNYDESGVGTPKSRLQVAKEVITNLINRTDNVRFGLMRFNYDQGGYVVAGCGADKTTLVNRINAMSANGWTPLAETLAEAGLYYAGQDSWFNSGVHYTSPIQERCQKNYIVIMTDGEPTHDVDWHLSTGSYINGDTIGDYDHDGNESTVVYADNGSDYLDDVAKYLYENDCLPTMGDGTAFDKQNVVTYTIGFKVNNQLLMDTAANGGGEYYTADNYSDLDLAFSQILNSIVAENAVFVAPVVPISRMNRTYAGDKIYLGFFKPQNSGRWYGNIKRYGLGGDGTLYDAKGDEATTADGLIKSNALSFWTTLGNDGPDVEKGGAAEVLNLRVDSGVARNIYTFTGMLTDLTASTNAFANDNIMIDNAKLGVANDTERQNLFNDVRSAALGDIIHSEPVVMHYPDDAKTMLFVGSNDGMLHCFDDDDGGEAWGFIPPDQLSRLKLLGNADHDYFVDGSPVIYSSATQNILILGERRGGSYYTALDVTNYNAPQFLYSIGPNFLDPHPFNSPDTDVYEVLGQSWSKPERCTVAVSSTQTIEGSPDCRVTVNTTTKDVLLLAGGYDNNQDQATPSAADSVGRAVFAVDSATGQLVSGLNFNSVNRPELDMTHSIVDVSGVDHDGDGIVSRIYAGDLGGHVFGFRDDANQTFDVCGHSVTRKIIDGAWQGVKLFNASSDGVQRKIFYAPDAVEEAYGEMIFFGTGDRADPGETAVVNRFYAVKNDWNTSTVLTETDLVDVTDDLIQLGTDAQQSLQKTMLGSSRGWFIRLEHSGEKLVASPRVFGGVVYFTTYTPSSDESSTDPDDPCEASTARGVARMYAVDYKTGASVNNFSSQVESNGDGNVVSLGKEDRAMALGTAIPSAPVIAVFEGYSRIFVGIEGGIASLATVPTPDMYRYFWNQLF
jgi:type IV pilus assembly protein PilY1